MRERFVSMADNTDLPIVPHAVPDVISQTQDWVVGVVDTPTAAEQAVQALREAGFPDDDIVLLHGDDAVQAVQARTEQANPLMRLLHALVGQTNEASSYERDYVDEARMGHSIINVHTVDQEDVLRVQQILEAHGVHRLKHYGRWTISQLSRQERDLHEPQAAPHLEAGGLTSQGQGNLDAQGRRASAAESPEDSPLI